MRSRVLLALPAVLAINFAARAAETFVEVGHAQCETDCSQVVEAAKRSAIDSADAKCAPAPASELSTWIIRIAGYGRLSATATFSCGSRGKGGL